jgi:hypothetical protein
MGRVPRPAVRSALLAAALGLFPSRTALGGDVVVTTTDRRYEGRIVSESDESVVLEETVAGVTKTLTIPRSLVKSIEREAPPVPSGAVPPPTPVPVEPTAGEPGPPPPSPDPAEPPAPASAPPALAVGERDEWFLLESDGRIAGTRHLTVARAQPGDKGWRLEEQVVLFQTSDRVPGVWIQLIEETDADLLPRHVYYRELGEAGSADSGVHRYETIRAGPVKEGWWHAVERVGAAETRRSISLEPETRGTLGTRERLLAASPRAVGLADLSVLDAAAGAVVRVRAGFSSLGSGGESAREDVLRHEVGGRATEGRFVGLRGLREAMRPGVVAVATTAERASAASAAAGQEGGTAAREVSLPDVGIALSLPGASWTSQVAPPRPASDGRRVVLTLQSRRLAADVRVEWEPDGVASEPAPADAPEAPLLRRLRRVSADVAAVEPRTAVPRFPGAWRTALRATVRGETVRTLVLVAERGGARVTLLATCPEAAFPDARESLESVLASFRWL